MPDDTAGIERVRAVVVAAILSAALVARADVPAADEAAPAFGRPAGAAELAEMPAHVFADGRGLPPGHGDAERGKPLYDSLCAGCHGGEGQGGSAMELVGDRSLLASEYPDRGIAVYWPYAPTLFEYVKRSMPPDDPYSLGDDEVYSIVAHLLELNGLIVPGTLVDAALLSSLQLPNRDNFHSEYADSD